MSERFSLSFFTHVLFSTVFPFTHGYSALELQLFPECDSQRYRDISISKVRNVLVCTALQIVCSDTLALLL